MPHPVDIFAGHKLKERRLRLGMSQDTLGKKVGVTFQQIQKYESGKDRMSLSKAYQFSMILDVPPAYFFPESDSEMPEFSKKTLQFIADYERNTPEMQRVIRNLVKNCVCPNPPGADAYKGEE